MRLHPVCALACVAACTSTSLQPVQPVAVPELAAGVPMAAPAAGMLERADLAPPWSLSASDGSGLVLTRVDARAVMEGPLAFTELHLWFHNPEDRQREGRFQITLPASASISRFAMEHAGQWMEAEVVAKQTARRAYEDFLHRRQDPALLEQATGNQFTARVFPISPRADKHLVISYSQALPGARYVLPLRGLPRAARVDVELALARGDGTRVTERLSERDWVPDRDFVASAPASPAAVGAGTLVAAQVELAVRTERDVPRGITLLVDTSASRALGFERHVVGVVRRLVGELRAAWGDALPLQVVAFDQETQLVFDGRADGFGDVHARALAERGAAGASDLGQAIAWLARRGGVQPRIVIVGDGVITAGAEGGALAAAIRGLRGVERIDVALAGGSRDERAMAAIVRAGPHTGAVLDLETDAVAAALGETVATDIALAVPGAAWVYPRRIASARAGSRVMVFARLRAAAPSIDVIAGGERRRLHIVPGTAPLVERALAGAELAELAASLARLTGDAAGRVRQRIAAKSVAARVLSRETAMLVLESEADYPRYGIDRHALADVLVVGPRGVERVRRADLAPIPARPAGAPATAIDAVEPRGATAPPMTGPDNDRDAIVDVDDACPDEAEIFNGLEDDDGCPDRGRVVTSDASIVILQPVQFLPRSALLRPASFPLLDAVAATMRDHLDIGLVEIQGHTDERGRDADNLDLSQRRADAVRAYLIAKGVAGERLVARGYGEAMPLDGRHTAQAWARNRRVEFLILRRDVKGASPPPPLPVTGELAAIQQALAAKDAAGALARARAWHAHEPGDVLALVGLGEALEAAGADAAAARAYGSIIDLFPGRADLRRFAGERLQRLDLALAIDTFRRAVADRPDHLTGHRLLAYALVRARRPAEAFAAILAGLDGSYRATSFRGGLRVLGDDAAMIGAVYARAVPAKRAEITAALARRKLAPATRPSTRFVVYWETDTNDVDLHVTDARGQHAAYDHPKLASGGELYADVTTGYGPECFAIDGTPAAGPYRLALHYYAQGPMGFGMGLVQIQRFDPARGLTFEDRPYVITTAHARLDLGTY